MCKDHLYSIYVLFSVGQLEKEEILTKLGRLTKRVNEIKLDVYELTKNQYNDFVPSLSQAEELSSRVQQLSSQMEGVSNTIEQEVRNS